MRTERTTNQEMMIVATMPLGVIIPMMITPKTKMSGMRVMTITATIINPTTTPQMMMTPTMMTPTMIPLIMKIIQMISTMI